MCPPKYLPASQSVPFDDCLPRVCVNCLFITASWSMRSSVFLFLLHPTNCYNFTFHVTYPCYEYGSCFVWEKKRVFAAFLVCGCRKLFKFINSHHFSKCSEIWADILKCTSNKIFIFLFHILSIHFHVVSLLGRTGWNDTERIWRIPRALQEMF